MCLALTYSPGTFVFARKELVGVTPTPQPAASGIILGKNCNFYDDIADSGDFREGKMASGRFIDITITADYIQASLETRIYNLLKQNPKVPFIDGGIAQIQAVMDKFLSECVTSMIVADNPMYVVFVPSAMNVPDADRANRKLTNVTFLARLAGAIQTVYILGTLTV